MVYAESSRCTHVVPDITGTSEVRIQTAGNLGQADQVLQCRQQPMSSDGLGKPSCLRADDAPPLPPKLLKLKPLDDDDDQATGYRLDRCKALCMTAGAHMASTRMSHSQAPPQCTNMASTQHSIHHRPGLSTSLIARLLPNLYVAIVLQNENTEDFTLLVQASFDACTLMRQCVVRAFAVYMP